MVSCCSCCSCCCCCCCVNEVRAHTSKHSFPPRPQHLLSLTTLSIHLPKQQESMGSNCWSHLVWWVNCPSCLTLLFCLSCVKMNFFIDASAIHLHSSLAECVGHLREEEAASFANPFVASLFLFFSLSTEGGNRAPSVAFLSSAKGRD